MRLMVMIVIVLVLLGGGGAGAYFYLVKPAEASAEQGDEHLKAQKEEKSDGHEAKMEYVQLDPLILPIIDEEGVSQVVSLVVSVEVDNAEKAGTVKSMSPRLKDAYIQDMYGVLNEHAALKGGVIQIEAIKKRLNIVTEKILGEDVAHDVLLQVVQQRPI